MATLVKKAFDLRPDQFAPPEWMWSQQFRLAANIPLGATKEQFLIMLQRLLEQRFRLAYHFEKREVQGYHLVMAKAGPKLTESVDEPVLSPSPSSKPGTGSDGFPDRLGILGVHKHRKLRLKKMTMDGLAIALTTQTGTTVRDATGISGKYDITLYWTEADISSHTSPDGILADPIPEAPPLFAAMQSQLGLKLESKKVSVDTFVIDHIEKLPTEN